MRFITEHQGRRVEPGGLRWGVESICRVLTEHGIKIATSTSYEHRNRAVTARARRDQRLRADIERVHQENLGVYGARKVWLQLNREGIPVARCTVERLMADLGLRGVRRGVVRRTTIPDPGSPRPMIWWPSSSRCWRRTGCEWPTSPPCRQAAACRGAAQVG